MITRTTNPDTLQIGANLRDLRKMKGFSQQQLGDAIGVTFQQIQKYENGDNRISVTRLCQIRHILMCSISDFFRGVDIGADTTAKTATFDIKGLRRTIKQINRLGDIVEKLNNDLTKTNSAKEA